VCALTAKELLLRIVFFLSEPSSSEPTNTLPSKWANRKRILLESDSDDGDDEEEGIYTTLHKRIISEISEGQKSRQKELDDKIDKELREQIKQLKENNIVFDRKKLKETISSQIYDKWAYDKVLADPELARQAGFDPARWIHK
jgi:hypothetical protein